MFSSTLDGREWNCHVTSDETFRHAKAKNLCGDVMVSWDPWDFLGYKWSNKPQQLSSVQKPSRLMIIYRQELLANILRIIMMEWGISNMAQLNSIMFKTPTIPFAWLSIITYNQSTEALNTAQLFRSTAQNAGHNHRVKPEHQFCSRSVSHLW